MVGGWGCFVFCAPTNTIVVIYRTSFKNDLSTNLAFNSDKAGGIVTYAIVKVLITGLIKIYYVTIEILLTWGAKNAICPALIGCFSQNMGLTPGRS